MKQDLSGGIIFSNLSLVIQNISHTMSGNYTCRASNTEGSAVSNILPLIVQCKCLNQIISVDTTLLQMSQYARKDRRVCTMYP